MKRLNRKPRTKSRDLNFDGAHMFGREIPHIQTHTYAVDKLSRRLEEGVCLGCGEKECTCKHKNKS